MTDFRNTGPVTAERAQNATQWLVDNAVNIATAKGNRDRAEHMLKVRKAFAFEAAEGTAASREQAALRSQEYREAVDDHTNAVIEHETLLGTRRAAESLIDVWRSINSSLRNTP